MLDLNDHLSHQRWLLENGFINDLHKDNLFAYGSIVHKDVQAVEVDIDITNKLIKYDIYVDSVLLNKIAKFNELSKSTSIIGLWRFRNLLRKEGNLNFHAVLSAFVKDYCGPKWNTEVLIKKIEEYEEGFKQKADNDQSADKRADK